MQRVCCYEKNGKLLNRLGEEEKRFVLPRNKSALQHLLVSILLENRNEGHNKLKPQNFAGTQKLMSC